MPTLLPPPNLPRHPFVLGNGTLIRPHAVTGAVNVSNELDVDALVAKGWTFDAASKRASRIDAHLLRKAVGAQARHTGATAARNVIGEVDLGDDLGGRVHVEHDAGADEVVIHGVHASLSDDVDKHIARAFRSASASFDAAQDSEEQTTAKTIIASLVTSILRRHKHIGDAVRQRKFDQRFAAV